MVWRLLAPSDGPPRILVVGVTTTVALMAGLLLVFWYQDASPPTNGYAPARLQNGQVLPAHVVPLFARKTARIGRAVSGNSQQMTERPSCRISPPQFLSEPALSALLDLLPGVHGLLVALSATRWLAGFLSISTSRLPCRPKRWRSD